MVFWLLVIVARYLRSGRLWTRTPLDGLMIAFIGLGVLNVYTAPFTRGLLMLGRPLLGMMLYFYCVEYTRSQKKLDGLLLATAGMGLLVGVFSLISTQWVNKSDQLHFITQHLPTTDLLPGAYTTFNPNEIAGAAAYLCPLAAGLMIYRWRMRLPAWGITAAFGLMFVGLFLGQSRFALLGVLVALAGLIGLLIPRWRWRTVGWSLVGLVVIVELLLVFNVFTVVTETKTSADISLSSRDESSFNKRFGLWASGLAIIRDYPLTGVGMSMYRHGRVREAYPAPIANPPHAHNEWIQVGTDLGLPGLLVYVGWYVVIGWMLFVSWRRGDDQVRAVSAAVAAGLLAHAVFGMGDAITLWDRFAFVYWWLLGLGGAVFILTHITDFSDN